MTVIIQDENATIVELDANYDALQDDEVTRLGELLLEQVENHDPPRLVIDMAKTTYINSSFIEVVFRAWKRIKERDGDMAICCPNEFCAEVLAVTRLNKIWTICATRDEALAALGG